ncbi:hypothetical protein BASA50_011104 [Batrachochytrium salamandrivorans]|uniref:Uncharacterized protein n=1 Tax=Batrachochytrium salamandrivorans TaxID=1357716 RepID=A0ABQ8EWQ6_9FUNG|nr:hypothetical protein BASA50_011104 [Batrachochytrium salamandrivorans]
MMSIERRLYGIGFNGFGQLDRKQLDTPSIDSPVLLFTTSRFHDQVIGVDSCFEVAIAWTFTQVLIFGWTYSLHLSACKTVNSSDDDDDDDDVDAVCIITAAQMGLSDTILKCRFVAASSTHSEYLVIQTTQLELFRVDSTIKDHHRPELGMLPSYKDKPVDTSYQTDRLLGLCGNFALSTEYGCAWLILGKIVSWRLDEPKIIIRTLESSIPLFDRFISNMCAGICHFVALTEDGEVLSWRVGDAAALHGQLGRIDSADTASPHSVNVIEALQGMRMSAIAAGGLHTLAVSEDGVIYSFGSNRHGALGIADSHGLPEPVDIDLEFDTTTRPCVAGGLYHSIVSDGKSIYGAGWTSYGQLGRIGTGDDIPVMCKLDIPLPTESRIEGVFAGGWSTYLLASVKKNC